MMYVSMGVVLDCCKVKCNTDLAEERLASEISRDDIQSPLDAVPFFASS